MTEHAADDPPPKKPRGGQPLSAEPTVQLTLKCPVSVRTALDATVQAIGTATGRKVKRSQVLRALVESSLSSAAAIYSAALHLTPPEPPADNGPAARRRRRRRTLEERRSENDREPDSA